MSDDIEQNYMNAYNQLFLGLNQPDGSVQKLGYAKRAYEHLQEYFRAHSRQVPIIRLAKGGLAKHGK